MSVEAPDNLDLENLEEYTEAEIEAYNQAKEQELDRRLKEKELQLTEQEREAVEALAGDEDEEVETKTVSLDGGVEVEVRTRIPPEVERLQERTLRLERRGEMEDARRKNCQMLATMIVTEPYDSADAWEVMAMRKGMQWLGDITADVFEPALDNLEETKNRLRR